MITLRVSKTVKRSLYLCLALSFVTGSWFYILDTWFTVEGDFGPEKHPWQFMVLKWHALGAFLLIMFYGAMLGNHVKLGWKSRRSRKSGSSLFALVGLQIISAYALYYLSDESLRNATELIHLGIGLSLPVVIFIHIWAASRRHQPPKKK